MSNDDTNYLINDISLYNNDKYIKSWQNGDEIGENDISLLKNDKKKASNNNIISLINHTS